MAYFPNGTSAEIYQEKYCYQCKNWKLREGIEVESCPILDVHFSVNYSQCRNKDIKRILEMLWPTDKDGFPGICSMFENNGDVPGQMALFK